MDLELLIKGLVLGFSLAAPIGPLGILCINRSLRNGFWSGFVTGLGAATADVLYALVAGLGITVVSDFLLSEKFIIQLFGIIFLFYLGIKTFTAKPKTNELKSEEGTLIADYVSSLALMASNPMTVLLFLALFSGLGLASSGKNYENTSLLVLGVFLGSAFWWLILNGLATRFSERIKSRIRLVNKISGLVILAFALILILKLFAIV